MSHGNTLILSRAKAAVLSRDYDAAERLYRQLVRQEPDNAEYISLLADMYVKSGRDEKAVPLFRKVNELNGGDIFALNNLGAAYRRMQQYQDSIAALEEALKLDSMNAQVYYNLGFTYKITEDYNKALGCFETVIDENPSDVLAYNHMGSIHEIRREYDKAVICYQKGLKVDQNHPVLHLNLAKCYEAMGQKGKALSEYEAALRSKPGWLEAINGYADLLMEEDKPREAGELVKSALRLNPDDAGLHTRMGDTHYRRSAYQSAQEEYQSALEIQPEYVKALSGLADSFEKQGKNDEACETIATLERIAPEDLGVKAQAARIFISTGSFDAAASRIHTLMDAKQNDADVLNLLGQYYIASGKPEKAQDCRKRIQTVSPGYSKYYADWGDRFRKNGSLDSARQYFEMALEKNPSNSEACAGLAQVYQAQSKNDMAARMYSRAVELDKDNVLYPQYRDSFAKATGISISDVDVDTSGYEFPDSVDVDVVDLSARQSDDFELDQLPDAQAPGTSEEPIDHTVRPEAEPDLSLLAEPASDLNDDDFDNFLKENLDGEVPRDGDSLDDLVDDDLPFEPEESDPAFNPFMEENALTSGIEEVEPEEPDALSISEEPDVPERPQNQRQPAPHYAPPAPQRTEEELLEDEFDDDFAEDDVPEEDTSGLQQLFPAIVSALESESPHLELNALAGLFAKLLDLCEFLPQDKQAEFRSSSTMLLIKYIVQKAEGKPGLLETAMELRHVFGIQCTGHAAEKDSLRNLSDGVLSDLGALIGKLPDRSVALSLARAVGSVRSRL